MILELAMFAITPADKDKFESAFGKARVLLQAMPGCQGLQMQRCLETDGRYVLLVRWDSVEHHMVGFRGSPQFAQWRALLGPYFAAAPVVEHYEAVTTGDAP